MPCIGNITSLDTWNSQSSTINYSFQHQGFAWCNTPKFLFDVFGSWATNLRPATVISNFSSTTSNSLTITVYDTEDQIIGYDSVTGNGVFSKTVIITYSGYDIGYIMYGSTLDQGETTLLSILAPTVPGPLWTAYIRTTERTD